jgi:hypothetical protein
MVVNVIIRRIAGILATVCLLARGAALEMPPKVAGAFADASVGESGGLFTGAPEERDILVEYVKSNWRELLPHFEEIQVRGNTIESKISVVGIAAEELEPLEYLNFLDEYLILVRQGRVPLDEFVCQIGGNGRKRDFIAVNWKYPKVKELLKAVMKLNEEKGGILSPDEVTGLQSVAEGGEADAYDDGTGREPPETLPGVKLENPFASLIKKATRLEKTKAAAEGNSGGGKAGQSEAEEAGAEHEGTGGGSLWGIAAALALLAFALWRAFFKRRLAGASR